MTYRTWGLFGDFGAHPNLGSDATATAQLAINTVVANGGGTLVLDGQFELAGGFQAGANAQLVLPTIAENAPQIAIAIVGYDVPLLSSGICIDSGPGTSLLRSVRLDGSGTASVLASTPDIRNNIHLELRRVTLALPPNPTLTGFNLAHQQDVDLDVLVKPHAVTDFSQIPQPTHAWQCGVVLPQVNKACLTNGRIRVWGSATAVQLGELGTNLTIQAVVCGRVLYVPFAYHPNYIDVLQSLECPIVIEAAGNGDAYLSIARADLERSSAPYPAWQWPVMDVQDPGNHLYGEMCYHSVTNTTGVDDKLFRNGGANFFTRRFGRAAVPPPTPPPIGPQTLLTTQLPAFQAADGVPYELGVRLIPAVAGVFTAIRYWKSAQETGSTPHVGHIWSATGQLLATVTFINETTSGWQEQTLGTPLLVLANTEYVVSVNAPNYFPDTNHVFDSGLIHNNLRAVAGTNGVFGTPATFPTDSYNNSNYFRDVVFVAN